MYERIIVVGLVVLLHLAVFALYLLQPEAPAVMVNEMSVSFANMQMQQADVIPQPKPKPREPDPVPAEELAVKEVAQPRATGGYSSISGSAGCRAGLPCRLS